MPGGAQPTDGGHWPFLGRDWFGDWRARRIRALLGTSDRHTAADFARMQADVTSTFAQQVLPALLAVGGLDAAPARALALLKGWDGAMAIDAPQPLIFNAWVAQFYRAVLAQAGVRADQGGPMPDFVAFVLSPEGAHWCRRLRPDAEGGARGGGHRAQRRVWRRPGRLALGRGAPGDVRPPDAGPPAGDRPARHLSIAAPGDDTTVDRGGTNGELQDVHGPGYRGVYDLADLDRSLFVMAPGQSGNLFSRHARDFLARWRDGATVTLGPTAARTEATLHLTPAPSQAPPQAP